MRTTNGDLVRTEEAEKGNGQVRAPATSHNPFHFILFYFSVILSLTGRR
jgi:hypothetical protein